jgi:uncharacterized membrane protein
MKDFRAFLGAYPMGLFAFLAGIVALIYLASEQKKLQKIFHILPCVFWVYFIPMALATLGIFPEKSPTYDILRDFVLPSSLLLLFLSVSIPDIIKLGPRALGMMFIGSLGIIVGAIVGMFAMKPFFASGLLPKEHFPILWKGVSALSGSWIGGSANMAAVWESVVSNPPTPAEGQLYSAMVAVDVIVAYSWMALVIALSVFQKRFDAWIKADTRIIEDVNQRMKKIQEGSAKVLRTEKFLYMISLALALSFVCLLLSRGMEKFFYGFITNGTIRSVLKEYTILIVLVTILGICLSFTPVRKLEDYGASRVGYALLYLVLARIGAMANLNAIGKFPFYILMGVVWVGVHALFLIVGARILRSPMFFVATSSQANIGGTVSAPVVAAAYQPNLAIVGLLMAVVGNIIGTFLALFGTALLAQMIF